MAADDERDRAMRAMVAAGAGIDLRGVVMAEAKIPGTHPRRPYATVLQITEITLGKTPDTITQWDAQAGSVIADQRLHLRRIYSIEFHGQGAKAALAQFRAWVLSLDLGVAAAVRGFGVTGWPTGRTWPAFTVERVGRAEDIAEVVSGEWEPREALEIVIEFFERWRYDLGVIETVPRTTRRG